MPFSPYLLYLCFAGIDANGLFCNWGSILKLLVNKKVRSITKLVVPSGYLIRSNSTYDITRISVYVVQNASFVEKLTKDYDIYKYIKCLSIGMWNIYGLLCSNSREYLESRLKKYRQSYVQSESVQIYVSHFV